MLLIDATHMFHFGEEGTGSRIPVGVWNGIWTHGVLMHQHTSITTEATATHEYVYPRVLAARGSNGVEDRELGA